MVGATTMTAAVRNWQFNTKRPDTPADGLTFLPRFQYPSSSDGDDDDDEPSSDYYLRVKKSNAEIEPSILDARDQLTVDNWVERNPLMVRLTGKHPFNAEAPLPTLMHCGFITPVPLHYVRNHGSVPKADWEEWTIEVTGLVKKPMRFTMHQLVTEFPSKEFPVTLVCAGNRRKEQNMVQQTIGFNWGAAGVSTSVWRGVPLRAILKRCEIMNKKKGALNVCFEGAETLPGGGGSKYGTSLKKEVAMDKSRDIILAYMQNGDKLTPDHGFPVRMIIPGFIGGRMVKWLKRIIVTTVESESYYHYRDNRVLPSSVVDAELANAQGWWYKPEYIINELNINSVITTPAHDERWTANARTAQRPYSLKGYAYSGGGRRVTRVEVSMDNGETWRVCTLESPERPNKYGKYWCWCFWKLEVETLDLLRAKYIAVRAWDDALNTQPENLNWNLMGMMNNCWFRVKINVCKSRTQNGEIELVFEHPTLPGNQEGGWMTKEVQREIKSASAPLVNGSPDAFSASEVASHNSSESAWIIVNGHVYDCTRFLKDHPGGADSILINAGTDCTEEFDAIHSVNGKKMLEDYRIGTLNTIGVPSQNGEMASSTLAAIKLVSQQPRRRAALIPREKIPCKLVAKTSLTHDVRLFKFALPDEEQVLGLPVGKHIFLCADIDGKLCMRAYTPSSSIEVVGYFELVVKIYFKGIRPEYPNGGLMSQHLESLELGSFIDVKGPVGHIEYTGKGNFLVHGKKKFAKKLAMIAGGTGITPIYQVIQAVVTDPGDYTEMHLVYASRTEEDILLRDELDEWAEKYPEKLKVWYVVSKNEKEGWKYDVGVINENVLREHIPVGTEDTVALGCGPPQMLQFAVNPNLEKMGYNLRESILVF